MPRETSRRALLAGLTASSAVTAASPVLPALAAPAASASPDAALIAQAKKVTDLARREHEAVCRRADLEDEMTKQQKAVGLKNEAYRPHERSPASAAIADAIGLSAQERICDALEAQLVAETDVLVGMNPKTMLGAGAKALAWIAIDAGGSRADWTEELAQSVARDVASMGGPADV